MGEKQNPLTIWLTRLCAIAAMVDGLVWLTLWFTGIAPRWSAEGIIVMKTNMALGLALAGLALLMAAVPHEAAPMHRVAVYFTALLVLLVGGFTLGEHLFGHDLGIDQVLMREAPGAAATIAPNRMGIPGSVCLILIGAGLLALTLGGRTWAPLLGVAVCFISTIPAIGFLLGINQLFDMEPNIVMAIPTILALLFLGLGLITAVPDATPLKQWMQEDSGGVMLRHIMPLMIIIPLGLGLVITQLERAGYWPNGMRAYTNVGALVITLILVFSLILWHIAAQFSNADAARNDAQRVLRESERRLRESERRLIRASDHFQQLAESMPNLAWFAKADGWVYWYNSRWYEYTGTTLEHMEGWGWQAVHDPLVLPEVLEAWRECLATGKPLYLKFPLRGKDGRFRMFLTHAIPLRVGTGEIVSWVGTSTEIDKMQLMEDELRKAKDAAESANAAKNRFMTTMSHDLRTPLNAVIGFSEILLMEPAISSIAPPYRENIRLISQAGHHLLKLVDGLLDLSAMESGNIKLQKEMIDINGMLNDLSKSYEILAEKKEIKFFCDIDVTKNILADRHRLVEILNNLVNNAIKYTLHGSIMLSAKEKEHALIITVKDTGVGLDEADLERIFLPFEQGRHPQASVAGRGVGLGLAISRNLVLLHGGTLTAQSTKGEGSCFAISLPYTPISPNGGDEEEATSG